MFRGKKTLYQNDPTFHCCPASRTGPTCNTCATGYFGKYLNQYGMKDSPLGVKRVPAGWTEWLGLKGNSRYYGYKLSANGKAEPHGHDYEKDYLTDLLANRSSQFLRAAFKANASRSVLAVVGAPAAHSPASRWS